MGITPTGIHNNVSPSNIKIHNNFFKINNTHNRVEYNQTTILASHSNSNFMRSSNSKCSYSNNISFNSTITTTNNIASQVICMECILTSRVIQYIRLKCPEKTQTIHLPKMITPLIVTVNKDNIIINILQGTTLVIPGGKLLMKAFVKKALMCAMSCIPAK